MSFLKTEKRLIVVWSILLFQITFFSFASPSFSSRDNILSILQNSMEISVIAIGVTVIIILGGMDISVGAMLGVLAILAGWLIQAAISPILVFFIITLAGFCIGLVNGVLVALGRIPGLIATIGTMYILRAIVFQMLGGNWLTGIPDILGVLTKGQLLGIPIIVYIISFTYILGALLMRNTKLGMCIYAIGSNEYAAELNGISKKKIMIIAYGFIGLLTGFASLLYLSRLGSVEITIGLELHVQVILAVLLGGTSILGGVGSLMGTLAGVFIMSTLRNGINLMGIPSLWERVIIGFFLLLSIAIDISIRKSKNQDY